MEEVVTQIKQKPGSKLGQFKILIIDDNIDDRKLYYYLLKENKDLHFAIQEADHAKAGIKLWQQDHFDCVLLDYNLPDLDGIQVLKIMRTTSIDTPIIILTGQGTEQIAVNAMKAGANDYLVKTGLDSHDLRNTIMRAINDFKLKRQLRENELLEEQNRLTLEELRFRRQFLHNISHELRTPLNPITGLTKVLYDGLMGPLNDEQKESLALIKENADVLLKMVNNVVEISEIDAGTFVFNLTAIHLSQFMQNMIEYYQAKCDEKGIHLIYKNDLTNAVVTLDEEYLKRVVDILLDNAVKFTGTAGQIKVLVKKLSEKQFRFEVSDSGIGISPENLQKLFTPFYQADISSEKVYQGLGLSLFLVKKIVEAQGGSVDVTSSIGHGSTFYITYPLK